MKERNPNISAEDKFRGALRKAGLKATSQRLAIHEAMLGLGHASADMVVDWLKTNSQIDVTTASVYNTLNQLAGVGIYSYRFSATNKMYFDVNSTKHFHIYDCVNHTYRDYIDEKLHKDILERIGKRRFRGFKLESIDIQFIVKPKKRKQ